MLRPLGLWLPGPIQRKPLAHALAAALEAREPGLALGAVLGSRMGVFQGGWLLLAGLGLAGRWLCVWRWLLLAGLGLAGAWLEWVWRWGGLICHLAFLELLEEAVAQ